MTDDMPPEGTAPTTTTTNTSMSTATTTTTIEKREQTNNAGQVVIEEEWTTADGANVFESLSSSSKVLESHTIELNHNRNNLNMNKEKKEEGTTATTTTTTTTKLLMHYQSFPEEGMTPLDMHFRHPPQGTDADAYAGDDEFYDGTGTMVWLASQAFVAMVDQDVQQIRHDYLEHRTICELGCGTGLAGMAALILGNSTTAGNTTTGLQQQQHVLFTDNDVESLELCQSNCRLNGRLMEEHQYSHQVVAWGDPTTYPPSTTSTDGSSSSTLVDTILATDVLYDIAMIPPLLQTAVALLKSNGHVLLSHVPRFCLPVVEADVEAEGDDNKSKDDVEKVKEEADTSKDNHKTTFSPRRRPRSTHAYEALEQHIVEQAATVGLTLVHTIRPHQVLTAVPGVLVAVAVAPPLPPTSQPKSSADPIHHQIAPSLERLEELHAVLFIFRKT
jgi:predicted nicotinamide N-methyase